MGMNLDNIVQQDSGTFTGTSGSFTLPSGTTAGNSVLVVVGILGDDVTNQATSSNPTGFDTIEVPSTSSSWGGVGAFIKKVASASETSWTLNMSASVTVVWTTFEIANADLEYALLPYQRQTSFGATTTAAASTWSGWTSSPSESYSGLGLVCFFMISPDTTQPTTVYRQGFYPLTEHQVATSPKAVTLAVGAKQLWSAGYVGAWGDHTPDCYAAALVMVFTGLDSRHAIPVSTCFGAEIGTATTMTLATAHTTVTPVFDGVAGTPAITTSTPRTGAYCLELSSTAAAEGVTWTNATSPNTGNLGSGIAVTSWVERFHVYFPTSLPAGDTPICSAEVSTLANGVVIRYVSASQKIGVKIGTGTEVVSDAVVVANQWIGIDWFYDPRTTTHSVQWAVDYDATPGDATAAVPQTAVTQSAMTAGPITTVRHGWTTAVTATVRYDDIVGTRSRHAFPIEDVRIYPLKVDTAATPTLTGTAGNWRTYTSNGGTLTAWSAANTRVALDDIPPTIGASSDGLAQVTAAGGDFVTVPMETFTCAPDYSPLAGRWYWAGWAASTAAGNIQFMGEDGVGSFFSLLGADVDSGFDNAATMWSTHLHNPDYSGNSLYLLTQAAIDGLVAKFGWSIDATPDVGVHAVLFELVVQTPVTYGIAEAEAGAFSVYVRQNPTSGAVVSYLVTTPAGTRGATFTHTIDTVDGSDYVGPNTVFELSVGATDISQVTATGLIPDPEVP